MAESASTAPDYSVLEAFEGPISRPKVTLLYQGGLLLVAVAMLLLPLVYLALVAGAAYAVYYHAVHHWNSIMAWGDFGGGRLLVVKFLVYFIPLFTGAVVVFFLLKPIFARRPRSAQPLALNPANEPLLYAFIEKICEIVGAPSPKRIDLDCQLNAAAGFRRGLLSFMGNDLVLTIGLPLAANLTARELAGVIAHEFGHFTQSAGMRLSYLIRTVNLWFARVVFERDAWDVALEEWSNEVDNGWAALVVWMAQIGVWFSRLILKILMYVGFLVGGFMLRQMEYHADACEIRVAGSEAFESASRKLATLEAAMIQTYKQLRVTWNNSKHLPDNLPALLRENHKQLPQQAMKKIDDRLGLNPTGLFDTHPSTADRIRQARQAADPGIFHDDRSASSLFSSFEHPARQVTFLHYVDDLGIPILPEMLVPVKTERDDRARDDSTVAAIDQEYFLGLLSLIQPLQLEPPNPPDDIESAFNELNQIKTSLDEVTAQLAPIKKKYDEASARLVQARAARRLLEAGVHLRPDAFGLEAADGESAERLEAEAIREKAELKHTVHEVADALKRRLHLALCLALSDFGEATSHPVPREDVAELTAKLNRTITDYDQRQAALEQLAIFDRIDALRNSEGETPQISKALAAQSEVMRSAPSPVPVPQISEPHTQPGLRLQLARKPEAAQGNSVEGLRRDTIRWFTEHSAIIVALVGVARAIESIDG